MHYTLSPSQSRSDNNFPRCGIDRRSRNQVKWVAQLRCRCRCHLTSRRRSGHPFAMGAYTSRPNYDLDRQRGLHCESCRRIGTSTKLFIHDMLLTEFPALRDQTRGRRLFEPIHRAYEGETCPHLPSQQRLSIACA